MNADCGGQDVNDLKYNTFLELNSIATVRFTTQKNDVRPYTKVKIDDLEIFGLLDSGASVSILGNNSHTHLAALGYTVNNLKDTTCSVANGLTLESTGYIYIPITFKDKTYIIKFYIIPDITSDLILGCDFWKTFNIAPEIFKEIDYRNSPPNFCNICSTINNESIHTIKPYESLTIDQRELATAIIEKYKEISFEQKGLGRTSLMEHTIETGDAPPIRIKQYPLSPEKKLALQKELDKMLELDVVTTSESPWNNPAILVKKSNGDWRFCLDCRKLNSITKGDSYSIPYIPQILDSLKEARFLSTIDLSSSFWQIPLSEASQEKTSFTVPGRGLFKFKVMPFGLCSAPARQQRLMDTLINQNFCSDIEKGYVFCYIDDIVICSSDFSTHLLLLNRVLDKLKSANLTVSFEKCKFFRNSIKYLGYVVDEHGLRTDPEKISAIVNFPTPTSAKEVKIFLGTCSWYRRFIRNFSTIAAPLNKLTRTGKDVPKFRWSPEAEESFKTLKNALVSAPILAVPDFEKDFLVHCDASSTGIGGMLSQVINGVEHPIAYVSRSLNKQERNYSVTEREALAVIYAIEKFQAYLGSKKFKIITDHSSLKWFLKLENPTGRLARWGCRLSQFNFEIEHRKGTTNVVPDALSRLIAVEAINQINTTNSNDKWFKNIFEGCQSNPTKFPNYFVKDNILYRYSKSKYNLLNEFDWKEVIERDKRLKIIRENHCEATAAHFGIFKTHRRLCLRYFWPGMYKDVVEFVKNCDVCKSYKHSTQATPGLMGQPKRCYKPFQLLSLDLVGPLPRSKSGHTFLLVITCCFSKFTLLFPLRRATSATVAKHFENSVILAHGVPECVILDQGPQMIGSEFRQLMSKYNIPKLYYCPKYTPQVNLVERYNKTIVTAIALYVEENHRAWDEHLPKIQFAINSAINESTGFSPFFLVHAREPIINGNFYKDTNVDYIPTMPREEYAGEFGTLQGIFDKVREQLLKAHAKNANNYNARRRDAKFSVGDIVWKATYALSDAQKYKTAKLAPKYEKCRITRVLSPLVYELERVRDNQPIGTWHIKDLKKN